MGSEKRKTLSATVVSDKMDKTVVVIASRLVQHRAYRKFIDYRKKFKAHDEYNECQIGDTVMITESRPLSRTKRWRVSKVVEKAVSI